MTNASDKALCALIADRHELFRRGVTSVLQDAWPHWSCEQATSVEELQGVLAQQSVDLLLLDFGLPGLREAAGIQQLRAMHPHCIVVVLGQREDRSAVLDCLVAGAQGYVSKAASPTQLLRAVETVLSGAVVAPASLAGRPALPLMQTPQSNRRPVTFTGRQSDVFQLLAEGCATKTIARRLDLAVGTVKVHLAAIYRQLGVSGRLEALARVRDAGADEPALSEAAY